MEDYVKREEVGDYRITIHYDTCVECPATNWDMLGCFLWEYDRMHILSESCNWKDVWGKYSDHRHSLEETLREMVKDYCDFDLFVKYIKSGEVDKVRLRYDRSSRLWKLEVFGYWAYSKEWDLMDDFEPKDLNEKDLYQFSNLLEYLGQDTLLELLQHCAKDIYVTEWSSRGYSQGDYVEGIAFVTKERYDKRCGRTDKPWKEAAQECIDKEVDCIGKWMWGDVYGYVLEKKVRFKKVYESEEKEDEDDYEWEHVDSCWGFYEEPDELIEEVMAEHNIKEEDAA